MRTLILNADYTPFDIWSWQHVMKKLMDEKPGIAIVTESSDESRVIRDGRGNRYYVPTVVALTRYHKQHTKATYTRSNIYARDRYICQYCGTTTSHKNRTIDHVIPKAHFKRNSYAFECGSFENVVTCCRTCNTLKRNRTPQQANMKLIRRPRSVTRLQLYIIKLTLGYIHPDWDNFINGK